MNSPRCGYATTPIFIASFLACTPPAAVPPQAPVPVERRTVSELCPGRPRIALEQCGCHPTENHFNARLRAFAFDEHIETVVKRCVSSTLSTSLGPFSSSVGGSFRACLDREVQLDPYMRDTMNELLKQASTETSSVEVQAWDGCYSRALGSPHVVGIPSEPATSQSLPVATGATAS